jgi:hypothetical protein
LQNIADFLKRLLMLQRAQVGEGNDVSGHGDSPFNSPLRFSKP